MLQRESINNTLLDLLSNLVEGGHVANRMGNRRGRDPRNMRMLPPLQGQENYRYKWSMEDYRPAEYGYNNARRTANSHNRRDNREPVYDRNYTDGRHKNDNSYKRSADITNTNGRRSRSKGRSDKKRLEPTRKNSSRRQRSKCRSVSNKQPSPKKQIDIKESENRQQNRNMTHSSDKENKSKSKSINRVLRS